MQGYAKGSYAKSALFHGGQFEERAMSVLAGKVARWLFASRQSPTAAHHVRVRGHFRIDHVQFVVFSLFFHLKSIACMHEDSFQTTSYSVFINWSIPRLRFFPPKNTFFTVPLHYGEERKPNIGSWSVPTELDLLEDRLVELRRLANLYSILQSFK